MHNDKPESLTALSHGMFLSNMHEIYNQLIIIIIYIFYTNEIAVYINTLMKAGESFWVTTSEFMDLLKGAWIGDCVSAQSINYASLFEK